MKPACLPLAKLSLAQKLHLMEALWADITQDDEKLESPEWHEIILNDRLEALAESKEKITDWEKSKKRIKKNLSCE